MCPKCGSKRWERVEVTERVRANERQPAGRTNPRREYVQAYMICLNCWYRVATH